MPTLSSVLLCATCLTQLWIFDLPPWPPFMFSILVCTFRYCSNCGLSCSLKFVYISICIQYVSMYGCSGDYFHTYTNRYLFLFCMIDTKPGASQLLMSDQVGCSCNIAVLPELCSLWFMHCECVIRNTLLYKFYSSTGIHNQTQWVWQCTLMHTHRIETHSMWPFLKLIFSSIMSLEKRLFRGY